MKSKVEKINWVGLMVEDFDAALEFFTKVLGMQLDRIYEERRVAQFKLGADQLFEIFGPKNKERKEKYKFFDGVALGFQVSNLDDAHKKLKSKGVKFISDMEVSSDNSWVMFLGPEKRVLQIQQPKKGK